jgi:hypothetical protein
VYCGGSEDGRRREGLLFGEWSGRGKSAELQPVWPRPRSLLGAAASQQRGGHGPPPIPGPTSTARCRGAGPGSQPARQAHLNQVGGCARGCQRGIDDALVVRGRPGGVLRHLRACVCVCVRVFVRVCVCVCVEEWLGGDPRLSNGKPDVVGRLVAA